MSLHPVFSQNSQVSKLSSFEQPLMVRNFGGEVLKIFLDKTGFLFGVLSNSEKDSLQKRFTFLPLQQVLPEQIGSLQKLLSPKMSLLRLKAPNVIQIEPKLLGGGLETEVDPEIKIARELFLKLKGLKKEDIGEIKQREIFDRIGDLSKALPSLSNYEDSLVSAWYVGKVLHMAIDFLLLTIWTRGSYENQSTRYSLQQKKSILDPLRTAKEILKAHTFPMKETVLLSLDMAETGVRLLPGSDMKFQDWNLFISFGEALSSFSLLNESSKNHLSEHLSKLLTDLWLNLEGHSNLSPDLYRDSLLTRFLDLNETSKKSVKDIHAILDRPGCSYTSRLKSITIRLSSLGHSSSRTVPFEFDESSSISRCLLAMDSLTDMAIYEPELYLRKTAVEEICYWASAQDESLKTNCIFFLKQISLLSRDDSIRSLVSDTLAQLGLDQQRSYLPLSYEKWITENLPRSLSGKENLKVTPSPELGWHAKVLEAGRDPVFLDIIERLSFCASDRSIPSFLLGGDFGCFRPVLEKIVDLGLVEENNCAYKVSKKNQDDIKKLFPKEPAVDQKALLGLAHSLNRAWNFDEKNPDAYEGQRVSIPLHTRSFVENVPKDIKTGKRLLIASIVFLNKLGLYYLFVRKDLKKASYNFKEALDRFSFLGPDLEKEVPQGFILPKKQHILYFFNIYDLLQKSGPDLNLSGYSFNPLHVDFLGALIRANSNVSSLNLREFDDKKIKAIASRLKGSKLISLSLESNKIGYEGGRALYEGGRALAELLPDSQITRLSLFGNQMSDTAAKALDDSIEHSNITELSLENSGINGKRLETLVSSMSFSKLTYLNLASNIICESNSRGIKALAETLKYFPLVNLNLRSNHIDDRGALALAAAIPSSKLTRLDLSSNQISSEGARAIANSSSSSNLTYLDLSENQIDGWEGILLIGLSRSSKLTYFDLRRDKVGFEGDEAIDGSTAFSEMTNLDLSENEIDDRGARLLAAAIPYSRWTYLDLRSNQMSFEGVCSLAESLPSSLITYLDLSQSEIDDQGARALATSLLSSRLNHLDLRCNQVSSRGALAIASALPQSELTYLDLSENQIDDQGARALATSLPSSRLNHLDLGVNQIGFQGVQAIADSLRSSRLNHLDLRVNQISFERARPMVNARTLSQITYIDLSENQVDDRGAWALASALPSSMLNHLDLRVNQIGFQGVLAIANVLGSSRLTYLDLSDNQIDDRGVIALAGALPFSRLNHLDLGLNQICFQGARAIADALHQSELTYLDLSENQIDYRGVWDLARSLFSSKLTYLNLRDNQIDDQGAIRLAGSLSSSMLNHLDLSCNQIGFQGVLAIANVIGSSRLTYLDLSENQVDDRGVIVLASALPFSRLNHLDLGLNQICFQWAARAIADALPQSELTYLDLRRNQISFEGARAIADALPYSRLTYLNLSENQINDQGARALAASIPSSKLNHLDLRWNQISPKEAQAIADSLPFSLMFPNGPTSD